MISNIFGLPGSGKTTFAAAIAHRALRGKAVRCGGYFLTSRDDYAFVYSNTPIRGCSQLDLEMVGHYSFRDSLLIIDESVMLADSRDFRSLDKSLMMFMKQHRKYGCDIILISQGYKDNDLRLRDLCENTYYCKRRSFGRSTLYCIEKSVHIDKSIEERYDLGGLFSRWTIRRKKYYSMFDTLYIHGKPLPDLDSPSPWFIPEPDKMHKFELRNLVAGLCKIPKKACGLIGRLFRRPCSTGTDSRGTV